MGRPCRHRQGPGLSPRGQSFKSTARISRSIIGPWGRQNTLKSHSKTEGEMEFWPSCCKHIRTECPAVGRLLSSQYGFAFPKGGTAQIQSAFFEFWESIEFLRSLFGHSEDLTAPFRSTFPGALNPPEQLSCQQTRQNIIWIGSDATLDMCGEINFSNSTYTRFPAEMIKRYFSHDLDDDDLIIAITELCRFLLLY